MPQQRVLPTVCAAKVVNAHEAEIFGGVGVFFFSFEVTIQH